MDVRLPLTGFLLLTLGSALYAQTDSVKSANEIIRLEQQLADALPGDSAFWDKYLDPGWHLVDEDGNGSFKQPFLDGFKPWPKTISGHVTVTKPVFTFHDNVAVVQYVADEYETAYGQQLHTTYGTMDVWYKTDTSWMMLSMQDFEIPALPPAIKVDPDILKRYAGTYRLTPDKLAVVSVKNNSLFIQKSKGNAEKLFAETDQIFFRTTDARGRKYFVKDGNGHWLMLERRNGQDLTWRKTK